MSSDSAQEQCTYEYPS